MSLGDLQRRVVTTFVVDTTQMQSGVSEANKKFGEFGEKIVESAKSANEGLNSIFEKAHELSASFEGLKKIGEFMWEGYKDGIQDARNATASFGLNLEALKESAHGLVTENDLLAFSAKAMKSAYGNTQADMEMAEKAMLALERRGVSVADATNAVTEALVSGKTRGLEPYGVVIDRHIKDLQTMGEENLTLAQKEELHGRALKSLATLSAEVVDGQDAQGESMGRSVTKVKDAWDDMKKSIGQLVVAMQPLIEGLATIVGHVAKIIDKAANIHSFSDVIDTDLDIIGFLSPFQNQVAGPSGKSMPGGWGAFSGQNERTAGAARDASIMAKRNAGDQYAGEFAMTDEDVSKFEAKQKKIEEATARAAAALAEYTRRLSGIQSTELDNQAKLRASANDGSRAGSTSFGVAAGYDGIGSAGFADLGRVTNDVRQKQIDDLTENWKKGAAASTKNRESFLEKSFGKVEDFDVYKKAFETLTGATTAALGAWINGSMSAGQAFKKFIGDALAGLASQMLVESLKHAAYALGSLAFYDYNGAARHAAAAAAFGGGAALAAVAAKELGGAPASGGGGASAGSGAGSGGASTRSSSSTSSPIIVYGDSFSDDSPRNRQIKAKQLVSLALGSSTGMKNGG